MATRYIARYPTNPNAGPANDTSAPIYVDKDDNILKMVPAGSGTTEVQVVDASSAQTLTNKTLTSPILNTPTLNSPTISGATMAVGTATFPFIAAYDATGVGIAGVKSAYGTSTLITGAKVVATGLASVVAFVATLAETGFATGAAQVLSVSSITTGAVTVKGFFNTNATGATLASTGTGSFYWLALGT